MVQREGRHEKNHHVVMGSRVHQRQFCSPFVLNFSSAGCVMHYYKRNLGDYSKKAGRLSMLQHGAYNLLIDACYDREQFPTMDEAIEWTWASTDEEIAAVKFVLKRFFVEVDGVFVQKRIQEEIAEYRSKAQKNKRIAEEREAKRQKQQPNEHEPSTERARLVNGSTKDGHLTNNQEPITNIYRDTQRASRLPADWSPSDDMIEFCQQERPDLTPDFVAQRFRDYWLAQPGAKGRKLDWQATWRNWVRNEKAVPQPTSTARRLVL